MYVTESHIRLGQTVLSAGFSARRQIHGVSMKSKNSSIEYDVGYCKPPKEHEFRTGQSGNPKGRPKGTRNLRTDVEELLSGKLTLADGTRVSRQKAILLKLFAEAMKGKPAAIREMIALVMKFSADDVAEDGVPNLNVEDIEIIEALLRRQKPE